MKILIIGAGVLGSIYAAKLTQAGRDVTLLARGARLEQLREYGVVLESSLDGTQVATLVKLTESLQPDDRYDLALVIMRQNQVDSVLPLLAANPYIKTIAFLMNNAVGAKPFTDVLGEERVLLGFAGAGGLRKEHVVVVSMGKKGFEGATIVGEAKGGISPRLKQVAEVFEGSGLEAQVEEDVDAWLKTHLALVLPLALGLYAANGDVYRAARTRAVLVLIIRAFREGLAALRKLNISITPGKYRWFSLFSEGLLVLFLKRVLASRFAEVSLAGHANAARDEMTYLSRQFYALVQQSGVAHPAWDILYTYINENISLIPDGQRQL